MIGQTGQRGVHRLNLDTIGLDGDRGQRTHLERLRGMKCKK